MKSNHALLDIFKGYSWAIVVLIIASLAIFVFLIGGGGVKESECKLSSGFSCVSQPVGGEFNKTISFQLTNNNNFPIQITNLESIICSEIENISLDIGETELIEMKQCNIIYGERYEESITINYINTLNQEESSLLANIIFRGTK